MKNRKNGWAADAGWSAFIIAIVLYLLGSEYLDRKYPKTPPLCPNCEAALDQDANTGD